MKSKHTNPVFLTTSVILLLILFIRTTRGLDLSDEMQYYGQIKGLIESGKLFSNDLFIQQTVYILFYPAFYLYHLVFGFDGLVFFGRIMMSVLSIIMFLYTYRKLIEFEISVVVASLTALSLVFAIPYHGVFAPSYNTISQVIWIVFIIRFFEWKRSGAISWGIFPILMFFAHPTSAALMSFLILVRLLVELNFRQIGQLLLVYFVGALIVLPIMTYFASPQEYLASIIFSAGYGVGTTFFSSKQQYISLILIYAMFVSSYLLWRLFPKLNISILMILCLSVAIILFSVGLVQGGYSRWVVYVLSSVSALSYGLALFNVPSDEPKLRWRIHWLVVLILSFATVLAVTSGNGIGQSTGAFMVGLPVLTGIAVRQVQRKEVAGNLSLLNMSCVVLVLILFVVHWSRYPYREDGWWRTNHSIQSLREFRFINTSFERAEFVHRMQQVLGPVTQGKRTLIISEYPALYLALDTLPETCMLYMHSVTSDKSEKTLIDCLSRKSPEVVVDISSNISMSSDGSRIKNVMHKFYSNRGFVCTADSIKFHSNSNFNPEQLKFSVCKQPV